MKKSIKASFMNVQIDYKIDSQRVKILTFIPNNYEKSHG
jgi:hypothetical protein